MSDKNERPNKAHNTKPPTPPPGAAENRQWTGSRIKCDPVVEGVKRNRRGDVVGKRSVEDMLRIFRKRVSKSGVLQVFRDKQSYTKPSDERRAKRQEIEYKIEKANERREEIKRSRTMGK